MDLKSKMPKKGELQIKSKINQQQTRCQRLKQIKRSCKDLVTTTINEE